MSSSERSGSRTRDLALFVVSATGGSVTAFLFTKAFLALWFIPFTSVGLTSIAVSYLPRVEKVERYALHASVAVILTSISWHFYLRGLDMEQRSQALSGDLVQSREVVANPDHPILKIGPLGKELTGGWSPGVSQAMFKFERNGELSLEASNGLVKVSTPIRDREGHLIAELNENHWQVYPPYCSGKNFTKDALEVKDSAGRVVFQIRLSGVHAEIQGIWRNERGEQIEFINSMIMNLGVSGDAVDLRPMFKYPESRHLGQYTNDGSEW